MIRHDKMNEAEAPVGGGGAADAAVIASATEAIAQAKAAEAQFKAQREALEQRLAALEAKPAVVAPVAPEGLDEVKRFMTRERNDRRVETIRRMGLDAPLTDEEVLKLTPDVDPREPDGLAKLEAWRAANATKFRQQGQTQQSVVEALKPQLDELSKGKGGLFDSGKLMRSVFGGS